MKKLTPKHRRILIVGVALIAVTAIPSFAIFGLGDIVFDPTSYAEQLIQKSQQIEEIAKLEAQLETAIETFQTLQKSYTTAMNTYNQTVNNAKHFGTKLNWLTTVQRLLQKSNVESRFGEGDGFTDALHRVSSTASKMAWQSSSLRLGSGLNYYLQPNTPGQSHQLTQLAMIEVSDSISPDCLSAIGAYTQSRDDNSDALDELEDDQFDDGDDTNSEVEQLNLLNAAHAQQMNELQAQGALHNCAAGQMTVTNMQLRNAAAQDLNTWAAVNDQRTANPSGNVSTHNTWTTFLP
jgi:hypothetical protein